jgi:SAM-dependent methyltransferase
MTPACVVCGAELRPWFQKLDRSVHRCPACAHIAVPAGLARAADGLSIYEGEQSVFYADGNEEYYLDSSAFVAAREKLAFVARWAAAGESLLDIGSGFGHFLSVVGDRYKAAGIEVSRPAVEWAARQFGANSRVADIYNLPIGCEAAYDVVTMWDVIEHLECPRRALQIVRRILTPAGILVLSTPDAGSVAARVMGRRWHYLDPLQHIHLFSRANLARILRDEGFTVLGTTAFGRWYRIGYVVNRLRYLAGEAWTAGLLRRVTQLMPEAVARRRVQIKLWDVMGVAARKLE